MPAKTVSAFFRPFSFGLLLILCAGLFWIGCHTCTLVGCPFGLHITIAASEIPEGGSLVITLDDRELPCDDVDEEGIPCTLDHDESTYRISFDDDPKTVRVDFVDAQGEIVNTVTRTPVYEDGPVINDGCTKCPDQAELTIP